MQWTVNTIEALRRGIADGLSFSDIAADLGCSRNAAIGKAHRLGLRHPQGADLPLMPQEKRICTMLGSGLDRAEVAAKIGVSIRTVSNAATRGRRAGLALPDARRAEVKRGAKGPAASVATAAVGGGGRREASAGDGAAVVVADPVAPVARQVAAGPAVSAAPDEAMRVRFIDRKPFQCAAIVDDRAPILERLVCGAPVLLGGSWCGHHHRLFFTRSAAAAESVAEARAPRRFGPATGRVSALRAWG